MASWEDVARIALSLPETTESTSWGSPAWKVRTSTFAWERGLRAKDLAELGDAAPDGPVLGASVPDEGAKHALIADDPAVYFTTSHFDGYPAVLVRLDAIAEPDLEELLTEAWLAKAPKRVAKAWLDSRS
ncbi:MmcQ/YjbR family DNA-binding protein [Spirilliplanes yamanashiensis]|uniref:MmcQ/YjbR family DNA-binding protein n=1 Tax=Spirilliplanes yamanashiensis TaxID=42233 RepID=A0A8J3Y8B1_9ACTN|nr:MmcQ/YjbR family DNA-binding protein [Spirilliplanes yamanashiensis]MDP9815484.1 hypothetical protein [Spirilliplanes yamanashiensis]GIJ03738.1 hypothetical protein Sya03_30900 [Spirilliplanes yamanashiensis]